MLPGCPCELCPGPSSAGLLAQKHRFEEPALSAAAEQPVWKSLAIGGHDSVRRVVKTTTTVFTERADGDTLWVMPIDMAAEFGEVLATREAGEQARHSIEHAISGLGSGHPVCLDFKDVSAITVPFADECVGQLLSSHLAGYYEDHPLMVTNANEDVRETLAAALRQRRLAVLSITDGSGAELLGGDELLGRTVEAAYEFGRPFAASEIAEKLSVTPQAANNRLKALLRSGALSRVRIVPERGGKEFLYAVPLASKGSKVRSAPSGNGRSRRGRSRLPA
jgi:DNA-binding transcriptional ArsR family regulator